MDANEAKETYAWFLSLCRAEEAKPVAVYRQLREWLEQFCRAEMQHESLQATDLAARISFVAAKLGLSHAAQNRLHTFRITSNDALNRRATPQRTLLLRDVGTLAALVQRVSALPVPPQLADLLPAAMPPAIPAQGRNVRVRQMRVCYQHADEAFLYVLPIDRLAAQLLRVRYNVPGVNEEFARTCALLWQHARLNLLDVSVDEAGVLTPSFIILEPDYLIDISALAECFKEYGNHPANYFFSRLQPPGNARPLLLGNIANLFLDEWIHAPNNEVDYRACMQKAFRLYPIELAACAELRDKEAERQFFDDCKLHFEHIRQTVTDTFAAPGYELDKADAVLEPSYICEALGLQGRLDYMQRDLSAFIEMKSGKADEYGLRGKVQPKENNRMQMLLYQAVLQYSMGVDHRRVKPYLFYTRYPLLYPAPPSWASVRRAIDLRNRIVADEYAVQLHNHPDYTEEKLGEIAADTLNERGLQGRFWQAYLRPPIEAFGQKLRVLTLLERHYFYASYNFVTKELYTSKSGDAAYEGKRGASALWLSTLEEKLEAGEILCNLRIGENHAADTRHPSLLLRRDAAAGAEQNVLPNFRQGDVVLLYERNNPEACATNQMIFKGTIARIDEEGICIRLRAAQRNQAVLPADSLYALEHDVMDTAYRAMYQGLYAFLTTTPQRRDLLLSQRLPRFDASLDHAIATATDDFERVALKAQAAQDYFLLVGPPGTGKTSRALRRMVERFFADGQSQLLLLSYTNRAVDEICKSLEAVSPTIDYIRVGSELSCEEAYRPRLLGNVLSSCTRRTEVCRRIEECRILVGTVAALAGKMELFGMKRFDVAIIDEATQILEPQLLGLLCARMEDGREAIGKFILIGDHKQLPAVVLQREVDSAVDSKVLQAIGLTNLRDSLFERLYRNHSADAELMLGGGLPADLAHRTYDMLCRQGRMHPEVASFANEAFYQSRLLPVGLPHQLEQAGQRMRFYPSVAEPPTEPAKVNHTEAQIVARLAAEVYGGYAETFDAGHTLGIIAPYRSQITLIRKQLARLGIPALQHIMVDTVERFQGSERDVIIYSFCLNRRYQLKQLANVAEEGGVLIDRKLNVALTRARKQMLVTGVPELLRLNPLYDRLLRSMQFCTMVVS